MHLLLAAFAITLGGAMQQPAMDADGVRKSFEGAIVAIQLDGDSE
ncbi:MAG: hypothetical protein U5N53_19525 [Mycobacterium sp.]|nr:hypothetical protein [Mycobacterium sp.]